MCSLDSTAFHYFHRKFLSLIIFGIILSEILASSQSFKETSGKSFPVYRSSSSDSQKLPHQQKKAPKKYTNHVPTIAKIFENPRPDDGYESLRAFSKGMTDGMFKTQLYNTSIALTSAIFSFQLPSNSDTEEHTVNMANQTIFGLFAMLTSVLIFGLPVLLTGQKFNPNAARSNEDGIISQILKTEPLARLIENGVPEKIGLEPEKCLQKTICEAHRFPDNKRYRLLAIPFQIFYPPMSKDKWGQSRATSYQEAAYIGKYEKTRCGKQYKCFFDVLDLGRYLLDWYQYHNGVLDNATSKD